jgi:hypothetical protein
LGINSVLHEGPHQAIDPANITIFAETKWEGSGNDAFELYRVRLRGYWSKNGNNSSILDKKESQLPICDFVTILLLANYLAKVSS